MQQIPQLLYLFSIFFEWKGQRKLCDVDLNLEWSAFCGYTQLDWPVKLFLSILQVIQQVRDANQLLRWDIDCNSV